MPVLAGIGVEQICQCIPDQPDHHHPFAPVAVDDRSAEDGRGQPGDGIDGHQAGNRCQRQGQALADKDHQERPDHGCAGGRKDQTEEHQPELAWIFAKLGFQCHACVSLSKALVRTVHNCISKCQFNCKI